MKDKVYMYAFMTMLFIYGTVSSQGALITEILTSIGYSEDTANFFGATMLGSGLVFSIIYSVFWINVKNQIAILEWVAVLLIFSYLGVFTAIYFEFNKYFVLGFGIVWGCCGFTIVPVLTEEVIKICSVVQPE